MPSTESSKFIDQNPDFDWHFGRLFMAVVVVGYHTRESSVMTRLTLPIGTRELDGLHRVVARMVENSCFPSWFHQRIFIQNCFDGPLCEVLDKSLTKTAFYTEWGKFDYDYWETAVFELTMGVLEARAIIDSYEVSLDSAEEWGRKFFQIWDQTRAEIQEFQTRGSNTIPLNSS